MATKTINLTGAEVAVAREEYTNKLAERAAWRVRINELER